ncbi:MAG: tape measure protein [Methylococcaceae bacterium]|nr:tape measure protein [Methylococcaceae bacterium]
MAENIKLGIILQAVDRATGPIANLNRKLASMQAPVAKLKNEFSTLGRLSGVNALGSQLQSAGREATSLAGKLTALSGIGIFTFKRVFLDSAAGMERLETQMRGVMGSVAEGKRAFDWVAKFAEDTPLEMAQVADAFVMAKNFGMDPMDGTLQALTDQMARMGKGADHLEGVMLSLGQAWALNRLDGQNVREMIQRGIPVWKILEKQTGRTTEQLQKMMEQGHLTRKALSLLVKGIGEMNAGASKDAAKTWDGVMSTMSDRWKKIKNLIMKGGSFEFLKDRILKFSGWLEKLTATPEGLKEIEAIGKRVESVFVSIESVFNDFFTGLGGGRDEAGKPVETFAAKLGGLFKWITDFVGGPGNMFLVVLGGIAAIMAGPLLLAVVSLGSAFTLLFANPVGLAIAAVGAAIFMIWRDWDKAAKGMADIWDGFMTWFVDRMVGVSEWWDGVTAKMSFIWDSTVFGLKAGIEAAKAGITGVFQAIADAIGDIIDGIKEKWDTLIGWMRGGVDTVKGWFADSFIGGLGADCSRM